MARSACGVSLSMSLGLLLVGSGSVVPVGGVTVAVLVNEPVAEGLTWTVKLKVTLAPTGRSTLVDRASLPLAGLLTLTLPPPLLSVIVQVAAVTPVGRRSEMPAPLTALGSLLLTTLV